MQNKKLFSKIKKLMIEKKINQSDLAKELNITRGVVSGWFRGVRNPKKETIERIANVLKVPTSQLLFDEEVDIKTIQPLNNETLIKLPILSVAECGHPDFCAIDEQVFDDFIEVPKTLFPDGNFIVRCLGNSMLPEIPPQAYCIIKKMETPLNNKNMLIKTTDGFTIKRIKIIGGKIKLYYLNPANKELKVNGSIEIIGKVIGIYQKY